jgi:hypothetical protein
VLLNLAYPERFAEIVNVTKTTLRWNHCTHNGGSIGAWVTLFSMTGDNVFSLYTFLVFMLMPWMAWAAEDVTATLDGLKVTKHSVVVHLTYTNHLTYPVQVTLEWPVDKHVVVVDNHGQEYALVKSAGMERRHEHPDYDLVYHQNHMHFDPKKNSVYLTVPNNGTRKTSFTFARAKDHADTPQSFDVTIGHRARQGHLGGKSFTFTAHFSGVAPTP